MWNTLKCKFTNFCVSILAYMFVLLIGASVLIIPITIICSCAKLIMMMFGG